MQCPRCEANVAFTMAGATLRLFDAAESATIVATIRSDGLIGDTHSGWVIKEHLCPDQEEPDPFDNRDDFWLWAKERALEVQCPDARCMAEVGELCRDLRSTGLPAKLNRWPHKDRIAVVLDSGDWDRAEALGYLS